MTPAVLFGAFDRHNAGDLLLAHVAARLLRGAPLAFAGLAARDLRRFGGHRVQPLASLAPPPGTALLHVGGQLLSCSAWQAAAMLLPPGEAAATIAWLAPRPLARRRWSRATLGLPDRAPYLLPRALRTRYRPVLALGVGGADLEALPRALRAEVLDKLGAMDGVGVRDQRTQALLRAGGVDAALLPDPAVLTARLFAPRIRRHAGRGEVAALRRRFPDGFVALQVAAEFGDDATLDALAAGLDTALHGSGLGVVAFTAGLAPWHDDPAVLRRLVARLPAAVPAAVMGSARLWDLCALLATCRAGVTSSLHARIVATAFGRPCLTLRPPQAGPGAAKHGAYVQSWEVPGRPGVVAVDDGGPALRAALALDGGALWRHARALEEAFLAGFARLAAPWWPQAAAADRDVTPPA